MTREEFAKTAKPIGVQIAGVSDAAGPKLFSTGSVGWSLNRKVRVPMPDGTTIECQVNLNVTVIGSKTW